MSKALVQKQSRVKDPPSSFRLHACGDVNRMEWKLNGIRITLQEGGLTGRSVRSASGPGADEVNVLLRS